MGFKTTKVSIPFDKFQTMTDREIERMIIHYFDDGNIESDSNDDTDSEPEEDQSNEESVITAKEEETYKRNVIPLGEPTPKEGKYPIKWVINRIYKLRVKGRYGIRGYERKYILKQFMYKVKSVPVYIVIMKQISGPRSSTYTLSKYDCKIYHIKYEPGLQVMSMDMNWIPCDKNEKEQEQTQA